MHGGNVNFTLDLLFFPLSYQTFFVLYIGCDLLGSVGSCKQSGIVAYIWAHGHVSDVCFISYHDMEIETVYTAVLMVFGLLFAFFLVMCSDDYSFLFLLCFQFEGMGQRCDDCWDNIYNLERKNEVEWYYLYNPNAETILC